MSCNCQMLWIIQQKCLTTIWIISTILMTTTTEKTVGEIIYRVDPLALLSATLRTYQKAVCDTEHVTLTCPRGTSISIEVAQYSKQDDGISIDELCPLDDKVSGVLSTRQFQLVQNNLDFGNSSNNDNSNNNSPTDIVPEKCMWPNALQYSLLQTVVEACQKKKHCKFNTMSGTYGVGASGVGDSTGSSSYHNTNIEPDPCPRVRKFIEIAYKCRPYEFRSKLACENDIIQLECNPYSRIAIYSASFGRTEYESIQCPQPQGVREETCLASYATETVMQICHGRRRCNLAADANTFGSPCHRNSKMYLKVVYTCVPKKVLKDRYESITELDEREDFDGDINELYEDDQFFKESEAIPKLQSNLTRGNNSTILINSNINNSVNSTNLTSNLESTSSSVNPIIHSQEMNYTDDHEHVYYLLLLAGTVFFVLCIIIVATRLIIQKNQNRTISQDRNLSLSGGKGETTIPNGFDDSISEIDADIDLAVQQIHVPSVSTNENYITYGPTSSLYGSSGPSNISQTSSTMLFKQSTNPLMSSKQSPDIIGVTNKYMHSGSGTLPQTSHVNCGMGTIIPISSMSQYTTAPISSNTFNDALLRRPESSFIQQPIVTSRQSPKQNQQQPPHSIIVLQCTAPQQQETFHYDGTAPRTLSTGVAQNAQFYYG